MSPWTAAGVPSRLSCLHSCSVTLTLIAAVHGPATFVWRRCAAAMCMRAMSCCASHWPRLDCSHRAHPARRSDDPGARLAAAIEVLADIEAKRRPARRGAQGLGPLAPLRRLGRSRRDRGPRLRRAAPAGVERPYHGRPDPRAVAARHVAAGAQARSRCNRSARQWRALCAAAAERRGAGAARRRRVSTARRPGSQAIIRNGSIRISPGCSARSAPRRVRRWRRARRSICASTCSRPNARVAAAALRPSRSRRRRAGRRTGLRIALAADARSPAIHAEPAFIKGLVEVQDEGSQLAALLSGAKPGEQVIDLCAGAGGKTLALAAMMENRGQIYATDLDKRRLAPIHARLERAGARNVQVRTPKAEGDHCLPISTAAPTSCSSMRPAPASALGAAIPMPNGGCVRARSSCGSTSRRTRSTVPRALVKPGGRIAYVTCSVLAGGERRPGTRLSRAPSEFCAAAAGEWPTRSASAPYLFRRAVLMSEEGLLMTPRRTDTDGFYVSMLARHT